MEGGRINVLCVANFFVPGFKGGGPIRSIANLATSLPERIGFDVFTRDRDLGAKESYPAVAIDAWSPFRRGKVFYAAPKTFGVTGLKIAFRAQRYDVLYLNSLFGLKSSLLPHLWNSYGAGPRLPTLIAPRGGLTLGALAKNPWRKRIFLFAARWSGLYRRVHWHASSPLEAEDIARQFPDAGPRIHIAPDLVAAPERDEALTTSDKVAGRLRLIFLSRISPMKNLLGLITYLSGTSAKIDFDIFGPIEDEAYWRECQAALNSLPPNVTTRFMGPVAPEYVGKTFADYDAFALPTFGENFGHVVFESLLVGTPVLISDRTLWRDDPSGAIATFALEDAQGWSRKLDALAASDAEQHKALRQAALGYAERYIAADSALDLNATMFETVAQSAA